MNPKNFLIIQQTYHQDDIRNKNECKSQKNEERDYDPKEQDGSNLFIFTLHLVVVNVLKPNCAYVSPDNIEGHEEEK